MGDQWAPLIELAVAVGTVIVAFYARRWLRTKTTEEERTLLREAAEMAVLYAEELGRHGVKGTSKLKIAGEAFKLLAAEERLPEERMNALILAELAKLRAANFIPDSSTDDRIAEIGTRAALEILRRAHSTEAAELAAENAYLRQLVGPAKRTAPNGSGVVEDSEEDDE